MGSGVEAHTTIGLTRASQRRAWHLPRSVGFAGGGVLAVCAVLMFLAPNAAGSTTITFTPPFNGASPITSKFLSTSGCQSNAGFPVKPFASTKTGVMRAGVVAAVKGCGFTSYVYADAGATMEFYGPSFSLGSSGPAKFTTNWVLSLNAHLFVNNNSNASVYDYAYVAVYVDAYVLDVTNFTYYYNSTTSFMTVAYKLIYGGHWSTDIDSMNQAVVMPGYVAAGHSYDFITYVSVYAASALYPGIAGSAVATVDLGTNGNGVSVTSFGVS